ANPFGSQPGFLKGANVLQAAFSPNGRTLATLAADGRVVLWDVGAQRALKQLALVSLPSTEKYDIAFSPDGARVAAAADPSVVVDVASSHVVFARPAAMPAGPDVSVAFSADGRDLATASGSAVQFWNIATGRSARPALNAGATVRQIQFSPDGRLLAT